MTAPTPQWASTAPPTRIRKWPWIVSAIVVVLALAAAAAFAATSRTTTVQGQVTGTAEARYLAWGTDKTGFVVSPGGECAGQGQVDDIRRGAVVTVYDAAGAIIGTGQLEAGTGTDGSCVFPFAIDDVRVGDFVQVEVAHRGRLTYSAAEVEAGIRMDVRED